jgi:hypothetical protein
LQSVNLGDCLLFSLTARLDQFLGVPQLPGLLIENTMKRIGDPSEKKFEKIPRLEEQREDESSESLSVQEEEVRVFRLPFAIGDFQRVTEADPDASDGVEDMMAEESNDEFTYEALLSERAFVDSFGVYVVFALKQIGLDLDVISLVVPIIHLHSLWRIELANLETLQKERMAESIRDDDILPLPGQLFNMKETSATQKKEVCNCFPKLFFFFFALNYVFDMLFCLSHSDL